MESKFHGKNIVKKMPITIQREAMLYNPINMTIDDSERFANKQQREKMKQSRFEVKHEMDEIFQLRGMKEIEKNELININKYKGRIRRDFDIINNKDLKRPEIKQLKTKVWDIIVEQRNASNLRNYRQNSDLNIIKVENLLRRSASRGNPIKANTHHRIQIPKKIV